MNVLEAFDAQGRKHFRSTPRVDAWFDILEERPHYLVDETAKLDLAIFKDHPFNPETDPRGKNEDETAMKPTRAQVKTGTDTPDATKSKATRKNTDKSETKDAQTQDKIGTDNPDATKTKATRKNTDKPGTKAARPQKAALINWEIDEEEVLELGGQAGNEDEGEDLDGEGELVNEDDILEDVELPEDISDDKALKRKTPERMDNDGDASEDEENDGEYEGGKAKKRKVHKSPPQPRRVPKVPENDPTAKQDTEEATEGKPTRKARTGLLIIPDLQEYDSPCDRCSAAVYNTPEGLIRQPCYRRKEEAVPRTQGRPKKTCYACWFRKQGCSKSQEGESECESGEDMGGRGADEMKEEVGPTGDKPAKAAAPGRGRVGGGRAGASGDTAKKDSTPSGRENDIKEGRKRRGRSSATGRPSNSGKEKTHKTGTKTPVESGIEEGAMSVDEASEKEGRSKKQPARTSRQTRSNNTAAPTGQGARSSRKKKISEDTMNVDGGEEKGRSRRSQVRSCALKTLVNAERSSQTVSTGPRNLLGREVRPMPSRRVSPATPAEYPEGDIHQQVTSLIEEKRISEGKLAELRSEVRVVQRMQVSILNISISSQAN